MLERPSYGLDAARYQRSRPVYPDAFMDWLASEAPLPHDLAIDVGAGTGQATIGLLTRFSRVLAIEPDRAMAQLLPICDRLQTEFATAENAEAPPAQASLVVAASALHWFDAGRALPRIAGWLRPKGAFAAFSYAPIRVHHPYGAGEIIERAISRWRQHQDARIRLSRSAIDILRDYTVFRDARPFHRADDHAWTAAELASFLGTTAAAGVYARATHDGAGSVEAEVDRLTQDLDQVAYGAKLDLTLMIEGAIAFV